MACFDEHISIHLLVQLGGKSMHACIRFAASFYLLLIRLLLLFRLLSTTSSSFFLTVSRAEHVLYNAEVFLLLTRVYVRLLTPAQVFRLCWFRLKYFIGNSRVVLNAFATTLYPILGTQLHSILRMLIISLTFDIPSASVTVDIVTILFALYLFY